MLISAACRWTRTHSGWSRPGRGEIRQETPAPPSASDVVVRTLYSGISRGTESLVFHGRVPPSEYQRMRAPFQAGRLSRSGEVRLRQRRPGRAGPRGLVGRQVFCLYPHQTRLRRAGRRGPPGARRRTRAPRGAGRQHGDGAQRRLGCRICPAIGWRWSAPAPSAVWWLAGRRASRAATSSWWTRTRPAPAWRGARRQVRDARERLGNATGAPTSWSTPAARRRAWPRLEPGRLRSRRDRAQLVRRSGRDAAARRSLPLAATDDRVSQVGQVAPAQRARWTTRPPVGGWRCRCWRIPRSTC